MKASTIQVGSPSSVTMNDIIHNHDRLKNDRNDSEKLDVAAEIDLLSENRQHLSDDVPTTDELMRWWKKRAATMRRENHLRQRAQKAHFHNSNISKRRKLILETHKLTQKNLSNKIQRKLLKARERIKTNLESISTRAKEAFEKSIRKHNTSPQISPIIAQTVQHLQPPPLSLDSDPVSQNLEMQKKHSILLRGSKTLRPKLGRVYNAANVLQSWWRMSQCYNQLSDSKFKSALSSLSQLHSKLASSTLEKGMHMIELSQNIELCKSLLMLIRPPKVAGRKNEKNHFKEGRILLVSLLSTIHTEIVGKIDQTETTSCETETKEAARKFLRSSKILWMTFTVIQQRLDMGLSISKQQFQVLRSKLSGIVHQFVIWKNLDVSQLLDEMARMYAAVGMSLHEIDATKDEIHTNLKSEMKRQLNDIVTKVQKLIGPHKTHIWQSTLNKNIQEQLKY